MGLPGPLDTSISYVNGDFDANYTESGRLDSRSFHGSSRTATLQYFPAFMLMNIKNQFPTKTKNQWAPMPSRSAHKTGERGQHWNHCLEILCILSANYTYAKIPFHHRVWLVVSFVVGEVGAALPLYYFHASMNNDPPAAASSSSMSGNKSFDGEYANSR